MDNEALVRHIERAAEMAALSSMLKVFCERQCGRFATMEGRGPFCGYVSCDTCQALDCAHHDKAREHAIKDWTERLKQRLYRDIKEVPAWCSDPLVWKDLPQAKRARRLEALLKGEG